MTDAYVTSLATFVLANLRPEQHVHVEFSNKVWDLNLAQAHYCRAQGVAVIPSADMSWAQFYGARSAEVARLWQAVWTGADAARLHTVLQVWTDNHYAEGLMRDAPDWVLATSDPAPSTAMTEYAVHGLLDGGLRYADAETAVEDWIDTLTEEQVWDNMETCRNEADKFPNGRTLEGEITHWQYHGPIAQTYGMTMIMYEGGTHIVTPPAQFGRHMECSL